MKLTVLFMFVASFSIHTSGLAQSITLSGKELSFQKIFAEIKQQTGYLAFGNKQLIESSKKLPVNVTQMPLRQFLDLVLKDQGFEYEINDKTIFIMPKQAADTARNPVATRGPATVLITDNEQHPLQGASVTLKDAKLSGITDANGKIPMNVNVGDVIQVTFIGFAPVQYTVSAQQSVYLIALQPVNSKLNETVVVGYNSQKQGDITGAISTIGSEELEKRAVATASFDRALAGMAKGVFVAENNGEPGAPASINIRGFTSPFSGGSNQPLFVIDGVLLNIDAQFNTGGETIFSKQSNPLLAMDPNNIENISILKDAAATAIYGSRGANGVIIITTKKGNKGEKPTMNMSYAHTIGRPIGQLHPMNTDQFKAYTDLMFRNTITAVNNGDLPAYRMEELVSSGVASFTLDPLTQKYTYNGLNQDAFGTADINWFNEIFRKNAATRQANLGIRGGTEATTYSFGGSYYDQEGVMINSGIRQYSFYMNVGTALNKYISAGASINLNSNKQTSGSDPNNDIRSGFYLPARPDLPVYDENGQLLRQISPFLGNVLLANPVAQMQYRSVIKANNIAGNAFLTAQPVENLKVKALFNLGAFYTDAEQFTPQVTRDIYPNTPPYESTLYASGTQMINYITNISADYSFRLPGAHQLNVMAGYIWDRTTVSRSFNYYAGFPDDDILTNINNARTNIAFGGGSIETGMNSIFTTANYNYNDRYLATINFRSDASSKFGPENKRGYFPSVSFGWNISNENFFDNKGVLNRLKLRLSAGKTGSSNVADFVYFQFFEKGFRDAGLYNGGSAVTFSSTLPNPGISWETTYDYNAGLDFDLKDQWLSGTIDVYHRNTPNGIAATPFPLELGTSDFSSNLVHMTNKGIEIGLNANIIRHTEGFSWSAGVNWAMNRNKIKSLNNATIDPIFQDVYIEGKPAGTIKGYQVAGIFQDQAEVNALNAAASAKYGPGIYYDQGGTAAGDYKFTDQNGDGRITTEDRVVLGNIEPAYFGGINNTFSYKGLELSTFFQFVKGNDVKWTSGVSNAYILSNTLDMFANNTWTPANPSAKYPRAVYLNPGSNNRGNDRQIYDASFLRLKTLYMKYSFNNSVMERLKLTNLSIFASASNLFTITKWPGVDPGSTIDGSALGRSDNRDPYPLAKNISFGLNMQL